MKTFAALSWLVAFLALRPEVVRVVSAAVKAPTGRYSWQQQAQRRNQDKSKDKTKKSKESINSKAKSNTSKLPAPVRDG